MSNKEPIETLASLQKELDALLIKKDKIMMRIMDSYHNHSATRARTTTGNANASRVNDSIVEIRSRMRSYSPL